jgi:hypothetical protein
MKIRHVLTNWDIDMITVRIQDYLLYGNNEKALELQELLDNACRAKTNERGMGWALMTNDEV